MSKRLRHVETSTLLLEGVCLQLQAAREALRKLAIVQVHRPGHDKSTVHVGWACKVCDREANMAIIGGAATSADDIRHSADCPLSVQSTGGAK